MNAMNISFSIAIFKSLQTHFNSGFIEKYYKE